MIKRAVLLVAMTAASAAQARPEPVINFKIEHYAVTGNTTAAISASVYKNTPVKMNGGRYGAVTRNQFTTAYSSVGTVSGGCEVKNARIILTSTIVLPDLVMDGQSPAVLAEWQRYIGALRAHEMMHANNGRHTVETLAGRLYNFKAGMSCAQMKVKLDRAIDQLITNMGDWDQRLDAQTQHGKSQGAYLRPGFN